MSFSELKLIEPLLRAIEGEGYSIPTPIQRDAIPRIFEGKDLIGLAQTGTGKTAAFALPLLQRLSLAPRPRSWTPRTHPPVRLLVVTPTRELASQVGEFFAVYGKQLDLRHTVIFGGVGQSPQIHALERGPDILVATPGRLLDLMRQGHIKLDQVEVFVLDEADRMLDMGFLPDVRRIISALPKERQTLLFSATMPEGIQALAGSILRDPVQVEVAPRSSTANKIDQSVHFVPDRAAKEVLLEKLLRDPTVTRALVFTRTKHGADRVVKHLGRQGIVAQAIHGNKSQNARERALGAFKSGSVRVLVATDIAARGLDVDDISHVINHDLPQVAECYIHRIGRTARAGASGIAISLCDAEELPLLADIEKLIRTRLRVVGDMPPARARVAPSPRPDGRRPSQRPGQRPTLKQTPKPAANPAAKSSGRMRHYARSGPAVDFLHH